MSTICALHGLVHMRGFCNACKPRSPKHAVNIVLVSNTEARRTGQDSAWDGLNGRPFIGAVVSEFFADTMPAIALRLAALRSQHHTNDITVVYL